MKLLFTAISCCFLFITCKKSSYSEDVTPPVLPSEALKIILSGSETAPYQFIRLQLSGSTKPETITSNTVQITIGSNTAHAIIDSQALAGSVYAFYLLVPEVPVGDHKITMKVVGGKIAEGNIKVNNFNKISDVSLYIDDWQANSLNEITDEARAFDAQVLAGHLRSTTADSLKMFNQQAYEKSKALVDALPESEKRNYVQLLDANKMSLVRYKQVVRQNPLSSYRPSAIGDCEKIREDQRIADLLGEFDNARNFNIQAKQCEADRVKVNLDATKQVITKENIALEAAKNAYTTTQGFSPSVKAFVSTYFSTISSQIIQSFFGAKSIEEVIGIQEEAETQQGNRMVAQSFIQNREYEYAIGLNLVNVNRTDASAIPGFAEIIKTVDDVNSNFEGLLQFLPPLPQLKIPLQKKEKSYVSGFTITEISDSRIGVTLNNGGKGKLIKFSLTSGTVSADINFTFKVNYTSKYGNASTVIDATLKPVVNDSIAIYKANIVGNWTAAINSNYIYDDYVAIKDNGDYVVSKRVYPDGTVVNINPPTVLIWTVTGNNATGYFFEVVGNIKTKRLSFPVIGMSTPSGSHTYRR